MIGCSVRPSQEMHASLCPKFPLTMLDCPVPYTFSRPDSGGIGLALPVTTSLLGMVLPTTLLSPPPCKDQISVVFLSRVISAINRILGMANTM